ncbi:hypothetical protein FRX31_029884, partial [Thalictrum thalictroides]
MSSRFNYTNYTHEYLHVRTYLRVYEDSVLPIPNEQDWLPPQYKVLPPPLVRPPGRPRKNRRIAEGENDALRTRVRHCSVCKSTNHTARTCKGLSKAELLQRRLAKEATRGRGRGRRGPDTSGSHGTQSIGTQPKEASGSQINANRGR